MKFMLGLPSITGQYDIHVVKSIINQLPFITEGHHSIESNLVHNTLIHNARNQIAKAAVNGGYDYLFFIDSDCVLPNGTLEQLVEYDKDIVAGMYFHKSPPFAPVIYKLNEKGTFDVITDYPANKLIRVDGIGMGICLIKTKVLKELGENAFDALPETAEHPCINGEDFAFCYRAKKKGFKIYADTGLQAKHQTVRYIDEDYFKKFTIRYEKYLKDHKE